MNIHWPVGITCVVAILLLAGLIGRNINRRERQRHIPILMYHHVDDEGIGRNTVSRAVFDEQLSWLKNHGYTSITARDLILHVLYGSSLPSKAVVITFDDGYENNYYQALPILEKYDMTAIVFVVAGYVGKMNEWDGIGVKPYRHMNWCELRDWLERGMEIGAHTMTHRSLKQCADEDVFREELTMGKKVLEEQLGISVEDFCYPFGDYDYRSKELVEKAGYRSGFAILDFAIARQWEPFALRRIAIASHHRGWRLGLKVGFMGGWMMRLETRERQWRHWWKKKRSNFIK